LAVDERQDELEPGRDGAVAQRPGEPQRRLGPGLAEGGERHQQEEWNLLRDERRRHGDPVGVLDEGDVRRPGPAREPGREQPGDPAAGRHEEAEPDRETRVRDGQQRRQQPLELAERPRPLEAGAKA
jgi:hypothetical protein